MNYRVLKDGDFPLRPSQSYKLNNFAKFCKSLRSKNGNVTRLELDKMVTSCLKGVGASQTPQLEGTRATMLEKVFT